MQELQRKCLHLLLAYIIGSTVCQSESLTITSQSLLSQQQVIAANYGFDNPLTLEFKGKSQDQIKITAHVSNEEKLDKDYCLTDKVFYLNSQGTGIFPGAFCEVPKEKVLLYFTTNIGGQNYTTKYTKPIEVTGEIHLAYFRPRWTDKEVNDKIEDFVRNALSMIPRKLYGAYPMRSLLKGRTVKMTTYAFDNSDLKTASYEYMRMKDVPYHQKSIGVIGMGSSEASNMLYPLLCKDGVAITSTRNDMLDKFSDKSRFPTVNRLHPPTATFLNNAFAFLKGRNWTSLAIVYSTNDEFSEVPWGEYLSKYGINGITFSVKGISGDDDELNHDSLFKSIMGSGYRMILTTVTGKTAVNLMKYAEKHKVTSQSGFQWIGLKNNKDLEFLSRNTEDWCWKKKEDGQYNLCGVQFRGMISINNMYTLHFNTSEAEYAWVDYVTSDAGKAIAPRNYMESHDYSSLGVQYGLAYDALKANLLALERLIYTKQTIDGRKLAQEIRLNTDFVGLTGPLKFDENGDRPSFSGTVHTLWPLMDYLKEKIDINSKSAWRDKVNDDWHHVILFTIEGSKVVNRKVNSLHSLTMKDATNNSKSYRDMKQGHILTEDWDSSPNKIYSMNAVNVIYCEGEFSQEHQLITQQVNPEKNEKYEKTRFPFMLYTCNKQNVNDLVLAPFYCKGGCGGGMDIQDVNDYTNGVCIKHNKCKCRRGWSGKNCEIPRCNGLSGCIHGTCLGPDVCRCNFGYTGKFCDQPVCHDCGKVIKNCKHTYCNETESPSCTYSRGVCTIGGTCIQPGVCVCDNNYYNFGKGKCNEECTCQMENAVGCNHASGKCTECKTGYYTVASDCSNSVGLLVGILLPIILIVGGLSVLVAKRIIKKMSIKAALASTDWIVNWEDVKQGAAAKSSMMISAMSVNASAVSTASKKAANCSNWEGTDVYVQRLERESVTLNDSLRIDVKDLRDLKHVNVITLLGCCLVYPNVSILWELQTKGSLEDLFQNEDIKLPWNFRFGLIKGICSGLQFLFKSDMKCHGRLKSSNCLIDNKWTVKLSGFGLPNIRASKSENKNYASLMWTAPEILKMGVNNLNQVMGNVQNDIYGLGIIMCEFCTRDYPFGDIMLDKMDLINLIAGNGSPDALELWNSFLLEHNLEIGSPVRPLVKDAQWPKQYEIRKVLKHLMESCWNEDPMMRPDIKKIVSTLAECSNEKGELIEILIARLEAYSSNLEGIVQKRTKQLEKETQRTEDLVSRLLPKEVSERLKKGMTVEPENFEHVTIYFSDIVGFTSIAKASTPMQVVAFLNNMYTLFDSISERHDVYKVETIGDAYMIVSGLPTRNGDDHAGEIATTALELMSGLAALELPHLPDAKLQLRSGIHTGLVVAGVVGLKMPRYCLFGDSVGVASSMESGGKPARIQVSGTTEAVLKRLGGYNLEYRHEVETDDGVLKTYWLNGKVGFNGPMPPYDEEE